MKRKYIIILLLISMLCFTSCGGENKLSVDSLEESTILIRSDGSVEQYIVETFNKNYYSEDDLAAFAQEKIDEYNQKLDDKRIELLSVNVKKKTATMLIEYQSVEDYAKLNSVKASFMTIKEAKEGDYLPKTLYQQGEHTEISLEEAKLKDEWKLFSLAADTNIQTDQEIKYYQDAILLNYMSVQVKDGKTAVIIFK